VGRWYPTKKHAAFLVNKSSTTGTIHTTKIPLFIWEIGYIMLCVLMEIVKIRGLVILMGLHGIYHGDSEWDV
jgi:hypothetical protein